MTRMTRMTREVRRGLTVAALSLPLALSLTGTATATGPAQDRKASSVPAADTGRPDSTKRSTPSAGSDKRQHAGASAASGPATAPSATQDAAATPSPQPHSTAARNDAGAESVTRTTLAAAPVEAAQQPVTTSPQPVTTSPQPLSNADSNGTGANPGGTVGGSCDRRTNAYCSTRDGSASGNGNGDGAATGKPCAGCVGKADNKNPPGQAPDGTDGNAGYECDRNSGVGKSNPAHTGCTPRQVPMSPPATCSTGSQGAACVPPRPTCPASPVMGPTMPGCTPPAGIPSTGGTPAKGGAPTGGGGTPIGGSTAGQPAVGPPVSPGSGIGTPISGGTTAGTPGQPSANSPAEVVRTVGFPQNPLSGPTAAPGAAVPRSLPRTGTEAVLVIAVGLLLLVLGGVFVRMAGGPARRTA